ncbi:MAG TPA: hypothetical protein VKK06_06160, partial [Terriglobia bacterium]|nr:hypothetical protein [Terriglobia bacterium]
MLDSQSEFPSEGTAMCEDLTCPQFEFKMEVGLPVVHAMKDKIALSDQFEERLMNSRQGLFDW